MDNSTTPLEGELLIVTQVDLVSVTTVAGALYGIAFTLFCLYVHSLVLQLRDENRKKRAKFMLAYSTVIMICGLYNLVSNAWVSQDAYIKHANYPGGPNSYIGTTFHAPVIIVGLTCQVVIEILTSAIEIWRVWVIWSATRYAKLVIALPLLCFVTWIALYLRGIVLITTLSIEETARLDATTQTAENGIQGATTIICTALISLFLVFQQRRQRKLIGKAQGSAGYMKVVAMLVESYALQSIWMLLVAVTPGATEVFFAETKIYIELIAYFLVLYRVASGSSYESQRTQNNVSSLHWNHSDHATTQSEETTEAGSDGHVSAKKETLNTLPVSYMA